MDDDDEEEDDADAASFIESNGSIIIIVRVYDNIYIYIYLITTFKKVEELQQGSIEYRYDLEISANW